MTTRDISVVRAAIKKVVKLLTNNTSIKVTQRGAKAFVSYSARTGSDISFTDDEKRERARKNIDYIDKALNLRARRVSGVAAARRRKG